jgi:signal transduction histidine kinase
MKQFLFGRYSGPFVVLGGLVAVACLASIWYINRLQDGLARAVRHDAARMAAAEELQIRLRQLRFHSLMAAADPSSSRQRLVDDDRSLVGSALAAARRECDAEDDLRLLDATERGYHEYQAALAADTVTGAPAPAGRDLIRWADAHPVREVLVPCRELADRQRDRMASRLQRSDAQSTWAGRVLFGLGLTGALGGLLAGYATARGLSRRAAQLSVRVRAVQAQLDQEVGALTVEGPQHVGDLDVQLDRVVGRVKEVCQRLQEQERDLLRAEQLAAVGHLAAGVAHEVRNPLTGIKFLVEIALRPANPTPLTADDLRLIRQEVMRIERTVQGLLDFARMSPPDPRPHDLREVVAEAAGTARGRAEAKPVSLRVDVPPERVAALVDHDQMLSLLTNLLYNAIDATPPRGEVDVRVATVPGGTLTVEVTDTGPGIDPEVARRLFTPFATTKPTGTGLGLSVARRVARDHGGTLTAANRPGRGAVFTLTLPAGGPSGVEVAGR